MVDVSGVRIGRLLPVPGLTGAPHVFNRGATEGELNKIAVRVAAGSFEGKEHIGVAVGLVMNRYKMRKHFDLQIDGRLLAFPRKSVTDCRRGSAR